MRLSNNAAGRLAQTKRVSRPLRDKVSQHSSGDNDGVKPGTAHSGAIAATGSRPCSDYSNPRTAAYRGRGENPRLMPFSFESGPIYSPVRFDGRVAAISRGGDARC